MSAAIGWAVLIALAGFALGNRWPDIHGRFFAANEFSSQLPEDLSYSEIEELYDILRRDFDGELTIQQLLDGLKTGLADATGDPYTVYLNEEESSQFLSDLNGTFTGIGAELGLDDSERLIIVAPLSGFPAEDAGLRAQDVITKINGEDALGIKVEEAVSLIRGEAGTDVTLTILRAGKQFDVTITREEIVIPSVVAEVEDGIGILRISRFADDTVRLAQAAARDFKAQNVSGVVLDIRNNSGGFLSGAVNIAGLWLDGDVVVQQRRGADVTDTQNAPSGAILKDMPTIVLINEGSASASEIVAGALKDHGAATIMGMTSFGKGSVQELEKLPSGGTLKVTIARWYTPNGNNIDEEGISPDIEVKLTEENIENDVDAQLNRAKKELQ
jgi:carboxyl-terminal processing protease